MLYLLCDVLTLLTMPDPQMSMSMSMLIYIAHIAQCLYCTQCPEYCWNKCVFNRRPKLAMLRFGSRRSLLVRSRQSDQSRRTHDGRTCPAVFLARRVGGGWPNEGAVVRRLGRRAYTARTVSVDTYAPSYRAWTWPDLPHRASVWRSCLRPRSYFLVPLTTGAAAFMTRCNLSVKQSSGMR